MKKYVSIDIGGTAIKYGLIGADGMIISRSETPTQAEKGGPSILEKAITITDRFDQDHEIAGICISTGNDSARGAFNPELYRRLF